MAEWGEYLERTLLLDDEPAPGEAEASSDEQAAAEAEYVDAICSGSSSARLSRSPLIWPSPT